MSTVQKVVSNLYQPAPAQRQEALRFVEALAYEQETPPARPNPIGLWSDLGLDSSAEVIDGARREMWGNFPREVAG